MRAYEPSESRPPQAVLWDSFGERWLGFTEPTAVLQAWRSEDVLATLQQAAQAAQQTGLWAVGFLGYEAAPAFDQRLRVQPGAAAIGLPLLWFGLYPEAHELRGLPAAAAGRGHPLSGLAWQPSVSRQRYVAAIDQVKAHIAQGDTYQVNYTLRLRSAYPAGSDPWALFCHMARAQRDAGGPAPLAAWIDLGDSAVCSASPELFFRLEDGQLSARPMKGTARRGATPAEDAAQRRWLYNSEKNRAENVMIVDMLRNDMGKIARTGSVHVPSLFDLEAYPTVWQMTSTVTCRTPAGLVEIMAALFPCASITGAPKRRTMEIITALEDSPRGLYTGCIGYLAPGGRRAQFNVAIRTAQVRRQAGVVEYGVGGGIVWDSTAEDEYQECLLKARVLSAPKEQAAPENQAAPAGILQHPEG